MPLESDLDLYAIIVAVDQVDRLIVEGRLRAVEITSELAEAAIEVKNFLALAIFVGEMDVDA